MARILSGADLTDVLEVDIDYAPLFAYGTLRPGEALSNIINVEATAEATVHGAALYTWPYGQFPYMVVGDAARGFSVHGDLLWVRRDEALTRTVAMELNAGYELSVVNVYTSALEEYVPAISFTLRQPPPMTGRIESGDWKRR